MDLIQCADCDAMLRSDASYCSNCARNIEAERALGRTFLVVVGLLAVLVAGVGAFLAWSHG